MTKLLPVDSMTLLYTQVSFCHQCWIVPKNKEFALAIYLFVEQKKTTKTTTVFDDDNKKEENVLRRA